jgi:lipopolysaccharide/colanic/teichoic acid biosynthesis glycosyltransferase
LIAYNAFGATFVIDTIARRALDLLLALIGLVVLSPIFFLIACLIKSEDHGGVFFKQIRVGQFGKTFNIVKFRTMIMNQQNSLDITVGNDQRITRVGRFLRKYKLDELPQLWNVFKGEMSMVGPRPEVPRWIERYTSEQRRIILSVRPGITDFAAIELRNEEVLLSKYKDPETAYELVIMPLKFKLYEQYIVRQSFLLNVVLIFKTLITIARK